MRLLQLEMAGFNNFGRAQIDLRQLPGGLIALIGVNGSGKTTMLDAAPACLYGTGVLNKAFPSRDGTLFTYATSREAYLDTLWDLNGRQVRCRVNVDGPKRKAEAVLEEIGPDGRMRPVNNGQVSTYRDAVTARFPSQRALLASAYASQSKRGGFGELGQKERMELFVELADLAHLERRAATARRCQQAAESAAERLRVALGVLGRDATPEALAALDDQLTAARAQVEQHEVEADGHAGTIRLLERDRSALGAAAEAYAAATARVDGLMGTLAVAHAALAEQARVPDQIEQARSAAAGAATQRRIETLEAIGRRRATLITAHRAATADREERVRNNRALLADRDTIDQAVRLTLEADEALSAARPAVAEIARLVAAARHEISVRQAALHQLFGRATQLIDAKARAGLLGTVKFGNACAVDPACPLVTDAVRAQAQIPALEASVVGRSDLEAEISAWTATAEAHAVTQQTLGAQIATAEGILARNRQQASRAPAIAHAEARIAEYALDGEAAEKAHATALAALGGEATEADVVLDRDVAAARLEAQARQQAAVVRDAALQAAAETTRQELAQARQDAEALAGTRSRLQAVTAALTEAHARLLQAQRLQATRQAEAVALAGRRSALAARLADAEDVVGRLRAVEDELLAWRMLARACGRDGLQRLEIDAAGPAVSDLANELLRTGYGTRFSVEFVTQVATADGTDVKEKFTIDVLDNAHGGTRDVGDLSGGERVIVEEAVRAALSCYVNLRSRTRVRTLWRDETTGALDPENAPRYVAMLRKLQQLSGAEQVLFVTHSPACAALADAQVVMRDGQATVALPPYREVAA